jgi:SAM-dependent MidA family methyltransferase
MKIGAGAAKREADIRFGRKAGSMGRNRLERIIRARIAEEGPISFAAFMEMALYHPEAGYYMSANTRIGPEGDFYTAPHLHAMFGWLVAIQLDQIKRIMGDPEAFTILEVGAGQGHLAHGVIAYINDRLNWRPGWRYIIVERNPKVIEKQKENLGRLKERVGWRASLDQVAPFCGCVLSNELLDAFPVHLVHKKGRFREIYVGIHNSGGFTEIDGDLGTPDLAAYIQKYRLPAIDGYRTEVNLKLKAYLADLDRILSEGFVVTIDYGYSAREYYTEERSSGTLLCYTRHTAGADPYVQVGRQDITAHVNFSSLKDWGTALGFRTIGYCSQGAFLASLGVDKLVGRQLEADAAFYAELPKIKSLLFGMGDSHQVMIQYKGRSDVDRLQGFELSNRRNRL